MTIPPLFDGNPADRSASVRPEAATPDVEASRAVDHLLLLYGELTHGASRPLADKRTATLLARDQGPPFGTLATIALVTTTTDPDPAIRRLAAALIASAMGSLGGAEPRTLRDLAWAALTVQHDKRVTTDVFIERLDRARFGRAGLRAALVAYEAELLLAGRPPHGPDRPATPLAHAVAQAHRFVSRYASDVRAGNDTLSALETDARTDIDRLEVARLGAALGALPIGAFVELYSGEIAVVTTRPTSVLSYARPTVQLVLTRTFEPHPPGVHRVDLTTAPHASQIARAVDPSEARFATVEPHLARARNDRRSTAPAPSDFPKMDPRAEPEEVALRENQLRERLPRPERATPLATPQVTMRTSLEKVTPIRPVRAPPSARVVRSWEPKQRPQALEPAPSTRRVDDPRAGWDDAPPTSQVPTRPEALPPPPLVPTISTAPREPRRMASWGARSNPPMLRDSVSTGLRWPKIQEDDGEARNDARSEPPPEVEEGETPTDGRASNSSKKVDASSWGSPKKPRT